MTAALKRLSERVHNKLDQDPQDHGLVSEVQFIKWRDQAVKHLQNGGDLTLYKTVMKTISDFANITYPDLRIDQVNSSVRTASESPPPGATKVSAVAALTVAPTKRRPKSSTDTNTKKARASCTTNLADIKYDLESSLKGLRAFEGVLSEDYLLPTQSVTIILNELSDLYNKSMSFPEEQDLINSIALAIHRTEHLLHYSILS